MWSQPIVRIWGKNGKVSGAGVLALPGYVVTCAHVVCKALGLDIDASVKLGETVKLDFPFADLEGQGVGGFEGVGSLVAFAPLRVEAEYARRPSDLAVISVRFKSTGPTPCILSSKAVESGSQVSAYGFPPSIPAGSLATGTVQAADARGWIPIVADSQIGQFLSPGFSGAPIFAGKDQVNGECFLGIAVSSDGDPSLRTGRIIPAEMIARVLRGVSNPYRPMRHFESSDVAFFYGRDDFCERILKDPRRSQFVVLAGPTGCGKSSVLRAGLIAAWQRKGFCTRLVPRFLDPLVDLGHALELKGKPSVEDIYSRLKALAVSERYQGVVLVIDQLEEMFPSNSNKTHTRKSLAALEVISRALHFDPEHLRVVLAIREDFLRQLLVLASEALRERIENALSFVLPLDEKELFDAIVRPAKHFSARFDRGLPELIATDALRVQAPTAMLQILLDAMWPKDGDGVITRETYVALRGEAQTGIEGAFASFADLALKELSPEEQGQLRRAMLELVETSNSRRKAQPLTTFTPQQQEVLQQLTKSGLISIRDDRHGKLVEIGHESLIVTWKRLQQWLHETQAFRAWRDDMRGRLPSPHIKQLLTGPALESALLRREQFLPELEADPGLLALIDESEAEKLKEERAAEQIREETDARVRNERDRAMRMQSLFLAAESRAALNAGDSGTALLLALEALPDSDLGIDRPATEAARLALRNALNRHNEVAVLIGHLGRVRCARFDQTGNRVLSGGDDGRVGLWDAVTGARIRFPLIQLDAPIIRIWISRDNQTLAVLSQGGQLQLHEYQGDSTQLVNTTYLTPGTYVHYNGIGRNFVIVPPSAFRPELLINGELVESPKIRNAHWLPNSSITVMAWHVSARCWVSGHEDGSLALWETESLEPCMPYFSRKNESDQPIRTLSCASATDVPVLLVVDEEGCMTKWRINRVGQRGNARWSLYRVGGQVDGVVRASIGAAGSTAIAVVRQAGRLYLLSIGQTQGNHDLGIVWREDVGRFVPEPNGEFEGDERPLIRISRQNKCAFMAIGPHVFQFTLDNGPSLVPIAVLRGAVRQIGEHADTGRIVVAGNDGTVRVLSLKPEITLMPDDQKLVTYARRRMTRNLTSAQRLEHYLDEESALGHVNEIVTTPDFFNSGAD